MVVVEITETEQRRPQATAPARIAALPNLPLFHKLAGRRVLVAGSSPGALWKAELLAAAGAQVRVAAGDSEGAELFADLAANPPAGSLVVEPRRWTDADFDDSVIAVADLGDEDDAERFVAAARVVGVPVNIVDRTESCDFIFGTIVNRDPIVLAISTDGGAPMLGQSIRARIEAILPRGLSEWGKAALAWRGPLKRRLPDFADRRAFWERFTRHAWTHVDRSPSDEDREALLSGSELGARRGRVFLVGAGPGDPELLTLKAIRALQAATVILYDDLVDPRVLELARREARRVAVGKKGRGPSCRQQDINEQIVALAAAGETVVRLKGGDPLVFGRAAEEYDACRDASIPVEIVPGISAAQGAAAALGFSLTERHVARRIQFVTGHGSDGKLPQDLNWSAIADPLATTIIYMGRGTLAEFVEAAIANGLDPDTPAVAVAAATREDQVDVAGAIAALPRLVATLPAEAPVTIILGKVARARISTAAVTQSQAASAAP
jgi:uroporphyrin-III C-methyltransferase / precorrin-2 dehydrogenase / sirohydrochlorin ferrochelatase